MRQKQQFFFHSIHMILLAFSYNFGANEAAFLRSAALLISKIIHLNRKRKKTIWGKGFIFVNLGFDEMLQIFIFANILELKVFVATEK